MKERVRKTEMMLNNVNDMKTELSNVNKKLAYYENQNVSCNLRVCGVPYVENENLFELFSTLCKTINIAVPNVISIKRMINNNSRDGVLIVKFCSSQERNYLLKCAKQYKRATKSNLTLQMFGYNSNTPIFLNEDLTGSNYRIFREALKLKKKRCVSRVFTLRGIVYVKSLNSDNTVRVDALDQLNCFFQSLLPLSDPIQQ